MRLRFNEISPHGNQFELQEIKGLQQPEIRSFQGESHVHLLLKKKNDFQVEMQGTLQATPVVECDRCLNAFPYPIDLSFQILFEAGDNDRWQVKEMECTAQEMDTVILDEPVIDVDDVLRQQLLLALPLKKLCSPRCKGICSQCGASLNNSTPCDCKREFADSPFAVLSRLKKNK